MHPGYASFYNIDACELIATQLMTVFILKVTSNNYNYNITTLHAMQLIQWNPLYKDL